MTTDLTKGKPWRVILLYTLPIIAGNMFQQLYSMVDTLIVGRGVGVEALAAVGAAGWLDWFVLGNIMGLMQGFTILISQRFGAEDRQGLRKAVTMSVFLSGITIVVFTTLALLVAHPILVWMNTPAETIDMAHL